MPFDPGITMTSRPTHLSSFSDWSRSKLVTEAVASKTYPTNLLSKFHKGWVNIMTKKFVLWIPTSGSFPYHDTHVVINPEAYDLTAEKIEDFYAGTGKKLEYLKGGVIDNDTDLTEYMFLGGWVRLSRLESGIVSLEGDDNTALKKASQMIAPTIRWSDQAGRGPVTYEVTCYVPLGETIVIRNSLDWEQWLRYGRKPSGRVTSLRAGVAESFEFSQLDESRVLYKGWVHPGQGKVDVWQGVAKPWHVQEVVNDPGRFGYTREQLLKAIEKPDTKMASVKSSAEVEREYNNLLSGVSSINWNIEGMMLSDGWAKVAVDMKTGSADIKVADAGDARATLKLLEKKVPMLPDVWIQLWHGKVITSMTRGITIETPAHYKTFVKTGRLPVAGFREWFESSRSTTYNCNHILRNNKHA